MNGNRWHYSVANQCCVEPPPKIQLRTVYRIENFVYRTLNFVPPEPKSLNEKKTLSKKTRSFFCNCQTSQILQKVRKPPEKFFKQKEIVEILLLAETEFRRLQYSEPFNFINRNKTSYTKYKQLHYILSSGVFKTIYKVSLFVTFLLPLLGLYKHN